MNYNPLFHHRRSIRLKGYDYSKAGLYFITVCTYDRSCYFGDISSSNEGGPAGMNLNAAGKIANDCWLEIPKHFPNVILHEHIVMPNHVHGIIEISQYNKLSPGSVDGMIDDGIQIDGQHPNEKTQSQQSNQNQFQKIIPRSVGSIVKGYKIGVTKWFRLNTDIHDVWHRNYYENIIRDENSYQNISRYIADNPKNWKGDKFYH